MIPPAILDQLRDSFRTNLVRNEVLARELVTLLDLLRAHGISAIPFKGPTLAASAYGHLSLRQFGDLDLFVPKCDLPRACEVLVSHGYRANDQVHHGPGRGPSSGKIPFIRRTGWSGQSGCSMDDRRLSIFFQPRSPGLASRACPDLHAGPAGPHIPSRGCAFDPLCPWLETPLDEIAMALRCGRTVPRISEAGLGTSPWLRQPAGESPYAGVGGPLAHELLGMALSPEALEKLKQDKVPLSLIGQLRSAAFPGWRYLRSRYRAVCLLFADEGMLAGSSSVCIPTVRGEGLRHYRTSFTVAARLSDVPILPPLAAIAGWEVWPAIAEVKKHYLRRWLEHMG